MIREPYQTTIRRLCFVTLVLLAGCHTIPFSLPKAPTEDVAVDRKMRKAEAIEQFDRNRNFAEFQAAVASHERGDLRTSQTELENLLRRDPKHRDARLLLATVHYEQDQPEEALAHLQTALTDFPDDPVVHQAAGNLFLELDDQDDAWAHLDRAKQLAAAQKQSLTGTAPSITPSNTSETIAASYHAKTDPNDLDENTVPSVIQNLPAQLNDTIAHGSKDEALGMFHQIAASNPNNPQIPNAAAVAALAHNRPNLAISLANEGLKAFPTSTALLRTLGTAYYRVGDYQSSQLVLQQALSLDNSDPLAYFLLGCTHVKLRQIDAANACFAQARRINPATAVGTVDSCDAQR